MSDALSFGEIDGQHAELLPARTVLSLFGMGGQGGDTTNIHNCAGLINGNVLSGLGVGVLGGGFGTATAC
ncbi:MAG: hypothetical protein WCB57_11755 [Pseudonocardiaceae bacterium]